MNKNINLIFHFAIVMAIPLNESLSKDGLYIPQKNGEIGWMSQGEAQKLWKNSHESDLIPIVKFYLYTNSNSEKGQLIDCDNISSSIGPYFRKEYPTRIIVHGWQNNYLSKVNVVIRNAFLVMGEFNVICVDWSLKAETINYPSAASKVSFVGNKIATLIDVLHAQVGLSFNTLHLLGHSLGAHICGFAGKFVKNGRIKTIVGMDPALPLFSHQSSERLMDTDAFYVETIHTCAGLLGFEKPIGKASFYLNGGKSQPGCGPDVSGSCAHQRSYIYYAESIRENTFPSLKCPTYKAALNKLCENSYSLIRMGSVTNDQSAVGYYYVPVNKKYPYGKLSTKLRHLL